MNASEMEARFDNGDDVMDYFDLSSATRPGHVIHRVDVDLPVWLVDSLDFESRRRGITRHELMLQWLTERETLRRAAADRDLTRLQ